ncbi:unnamed protein product [Meganyctiphanes norvegica]|uniref:Uncharacterized protein n=1 Tax=Meganyctiphanes norvegica TaxID=48144 RepID=A0AAV2QLF4_MEGNR
MRYQHYQMQNSEVLIVPMSDLEESPATFKSLVPTINNIDNIEELVGYALIYQYMFVKRTSPWEMQSWDYNELENFKVDLNKVDRLYYIEHFDDSVNSRTYEILVRMDYRGEHIFVRLSAGCDFTGFDCQGDGEIYITRNPNIFLKSIVDRHHNPSLIYQNLLEDGYRVEEPSEFDLTPRHLWNSVPMLKFLTHQAIHEHRDHLRHYPQVLPTVLTDSVTEFIQVQETRSHHDELV